MTEPNQTKSRAIAVESGYPLPGPTDKRLGVTNLAALRGTIAEMKVGDSFKWDDHRFQPLYLAAQQIGAKITIRKMDGYYRVWKAA
jgi:hypothetical protein